MENKLPNLGIIGYGSMGKEVEKSAKELGFAITEIFDIDNPLDEKGKYKFDVAIDFSAPKAVLDNVRILSKLGKNVVVGATGWYDRMPMIQNYVKDSGIGLLWGSNFSIGMQIMMKLTQAAARFINLSPGFDIYINEIHHTRKKDSPSGSALTLGEIVLKEFTPKTKIKTGNFDELPDPECLQITSARIGSIPGTHTVTIDSPSETITLEHSAKNRIGFASGALVAAGWIHGKRGFYKFEDILDQIWFKED